MSDSKYYDDIAKKILNDKSVSKKESIFAKHFKLIVELLKRDMKQVDILNYLKNIDADIDKKNNTTAQTLFSKYIKTKRVQNALTLNAKTVIIKAENIKTNGVEVKAKNKKKEDKNVEKEKPKDLKSSENPLSSDNDSVSEESGEKNKKSAEEITNDELKSLFG